jgi:pyridoxine 5-phosphate synthase
LKSAVRLGVNIDHAATLRQVRAATTAYPDLVEVVRLLKKAGAHQITVHLREDRRHIQDHDVQKLCRLRILPINLEIATTPEMFQIALKERPDWVCFVPEKRAELTTEGGLDVTKKARSLQRMILGLHGKGIKVSLFIEGSKEQVMAAAAVGADAVEFHTGHWVQAHGGKKSRYWAKLVSAALCAHEHGIGVHAGHGLDYKHTTLIRKLPHLREVNIGHSIICYALIDGLGPVIKNFLGRLRGLRQNT